MSTLLQTAFSRSIAGAALRVAFVVGTLLNLINQGPSFLAGDGLSWVHVLLNFLVPYFVATYSGATALIRQGESS